MVCICLCFESGFSNVFFRAVNFRPQGVRWKLNIPRCQGNINFESLTAHRFRLGPIQTLLSNHTCAKVVSSRIFLRLYQVLCLCFAYTAILGLPCEKVKQRGQGLTYQTEAHPKYAIAKYLSVQSLHLL